MTTFTPDQQKTYRRAFIDECHQKAWGASCNADYIAKELEEATGRYVKMGTEDEAVEAEIATLENAFDAHTKDNRENRKAIQERRNGLLAARNGLGANIQQGQRALQNLYQSIETNLALARHAEGYEWREAGSAEAAEDAIAKTHGTDQYRFTKDWGDRRAGDVVTGVSLGDGVIFKDLLADGTIEKKEAETNAENSADGGSNLEAK